MDLEKEIVDLKAKVNELEDKLKSLASNNFERPREYRKCPLCGGDLIAGIHCVLASCPPKYMVRCTIPGCNYFETICEEDLPFIRYKD